MRSARWPRGRVRERQATREAARFPPNAKKAPQLELRGLLLASYVAGAVRAYRAFLAASAMAANACGSFTAMPASTLRSNSMPAFFTPFMNTE